MRTWFDRRWLGVLTAVCGLVGAVTGLAQTASSGSINGSIQTSDGKPAARYIVAIQARAGTLGAQITTFNKAATTAADGTFTLTGVPNGTYSICPHPPDSTSASPCTWSTEPRVTVSGGAAATAPLVRMLPTADFFVQVNDTAGKWAAAEAQTPGHSISLSVVAPNGRRFPIPVTATQAGGVVEYHLPVPTGTNLVFGVYSPGLSLADATSALIGQQNGSATTVNVPAGQAQQKQVITIK